MSVGNKWHSRNVYCAVLRYISYTKFSQILEVLRDFQRLFGSRNSRTIAILRAIRHVYRSVWPAREAMPRFGATRSAHDRETRLLCNSKRVILICYSKWEKYGKYEAVKIINIVNGQEHFLDRIVL